jgi:hypothetical protein
MYYTGINPVDMKPVYVCRNPHEKAMQRALIQYRNPKNYELVVEALKLAHREDLIGFDKKCLVRPRKLASEKMSDRYGNSKGKSKSGVANKNNEKRGKKGQRNKRSW